MLRPNFPKKNLLYFTQLWTTGPNPRNDFVFHFIDENPWWRIGITYWIIPHNFQHLLMFLWCSLLFASSSNFNTQLIANPNIQHRKSLEHAILISNIYIYIQCSPFLSTLTFILPYRLPHGPRTHSAERKYQWSFFLIRPGILRL
jgi:hypothetical protein